MASALEIQILEDRLDKIFEKFKEDIKYTITTSLHGFQNQIRYLVKDEETLLQEEDGQQSFSNLEQEGNQCDDQLKEEDEQLIHEKQSTEPKSMVEMGSHQLPNITQNNLKIEDTTRSALSTFLKSGIRDVFPTAMAELYEETTQIERNLFHFEVGIMKILLRNQDVFIQIQEWDGLWIFNPSFDFSWSNSRNRDRLGDRSTMDSMLFHNLVHQCSSDDGLDRCFSDWWGSKVLQVDADLLSEKKNLQGSWIFNPPMDLSFGFLQFWDGTFTYNPFLEFFWRIFDYNTYHSSMMAEVEKGRNGIVLENVSYWQLYALSAVPVDCTSLGNFDFAEGFSSCSGPIMAMLPRFMEGRGVVMRIGSRILLVPMHSEWFSSTTVYRLERKVLFFSGSKLCDRDILSKSDPMFVAYLWKGNGKIKELRRTKVILNSLEPIWIEKIFMAFHFEIVQHSVFRVYDVDTNFHKVPIKAIKLNDQELAAYARVKIIEGSDLKPLDLNGLATPYVKGQLA